MDQQQPELHLTPGGATVCPNCGVQDSVAGEDGDTYSTAAIPETKIIAGGLAASSGKHSFHAMITLCAWEQCQAISFSIQLDIVADPEVTFEWANKYFWLNEEITEPSMTFTVTVRPPLAGVPESWLMERTETAIGILDRHFFGPFLQDAEVDTEAMLGLVWLLIARAKPKRTARVIQLRPKRKDHFPD